MSQSTTQIQILKRGQRLENGDLASQSSHTSAEPLSEIPPTNTPSKQRRKKQNQRSQQAKPQQPQQDTTHNAAPVSPLTPPRPQSQKHTNGTDVRMSPMVAQSQPAGKVRKKNNNTSGSQNNQSVTPKPRKNRSPQPQQVQQEPPQPSTTPAKAAQIYAGPTFHASPAASALPIPKFFSKSMPQVDNKEASLKAMMQEEVSEESASQGDESPTLKNSARVENQNNRNESPLDIFFKADRAEKARQQLEASRSNMSTPNDKFRAVSASPAQTRPRNHSRQNTDNAIFPIEMESAPGRSESSLASTTRSVTPRDNYTPRTDVAKTEALKQFLFQNSQGRSSPTRNAVFSSPSPAPPRTGQPLAMSPEANSRSPSPYSSIYGDSLQDSRPAPPRANSSHLRQEVSADSVSELPSTPTPARSQNLFQRSDSSSNRTWSQPQRHESPRPNVRFNAQDALRASLGHDTNQAGSNAAMEDTLRQILKLNAPSSTGVR